MCTRARDFLFFFNLWPTFFIICSPSTKPISDTFHNHLGHFLFFFAHTVTGLHNTLTTHGSWSLVLRVISWKISCGMNKRGTVTSCPVQGRDWAFHSHISDAWSMKVARVMSRWDKPPQSCVLRVIWTCNGAERKGISITSFFCNNILLLVDCFLDYVGNILSACWPSCEQLL